MNKSKVKWFKWILVNLEDALYILATKKKKEEEEEEEEEETIDIYLFFQCLGLQQGNETWRAINKAISF